MKTNRELLAIAKRQIGNGGSKYRKYVGVGGSWCDMFVYWLYTANGNGTLLPWKGNQRYFCPASIKWCRANLAQLPPYMAMPCDIIYFDWDGNGNPNHIGIVKGRRDSKSIYTIEGNTSGGKVDYKTRKGYIQGIYRPHFVPKNVGKKKLKIDGEFEYQSIYNLQVALGMKPTGVFTKETLKYLQRRAGATPDAVWGKGTTKKVQKMVGAKVDGDWGVASTKKLQEWVNKINYPQTKKTTTTAKKTTTTQTTSAPSAKALKAVAWAKSIAKSGKYTYKKWNDKDKKTKQCPVCHPSLKGKYKGWNCIGFVTASLYHGAGLKSIECSCKGIGTSGFLTKVTLASWEKRNGKGWKMITNGGSKGGADIPASKLLAGDVVICYDSKGKFHHVVLFTGNSRYIDCTNTSKNHIAERAYSVIQKKYHCTRAFRYVGK